MSEDGFTVSLQFHDGQTSKDGYSDFSRATWNFTEAILKKYVTEARITTDFGRTTLARWRRPAEAHEPLAVSTDRSKLIERACDGPDLMQGR